MHLRVSLNCWYAALHETIVVRILLCLHLVSTATHAPLPNCHAETIYCNSAYSDELMLLPQAVWRGAFARLHDGSRKATARQRLRAAALASQAQPHRQLGFQASQALQQLRAAKLVPQAAAACATLSMCTLYSKECCRLFAGQSGCYILCLVVLASEPQHELCAWLHDSTVQ